MMNWFKKAYNRGIPLMDDYSEGYRPFSSSHKKDPRSLVNSVPQFGGQRDFLSKLREDKKHEETHGRLPGESILMDQDPPIGEGVNHGEFVSDGDFRITETDDDRIPSGSKILDNSDTGPHNMHKNIFKKIKKQTRVKGLNF